MPKELFDVEDFVKLSEKAAECLVKRLEKRGIVKLKLRTRRYLYTLKVKPEQVDAVLKRVKCKVRELG